MRFRTAICRTMVALLFACSQFDAPDVAEQWRSRDGRYVAEVRNHFSLDPPLQTLWIGEVGGRMHRIQSVAADSERSNGPVMWTGGAPRAVYLDSRAEIVVVDPISGLSRRHAILPRHGAEEIRALQLSDDGAQATFHVCRERTLHCGPERTIRL